MSHEEALHLGSIVVTAQRLNRQPLPKQTRQPDIGHTGKNRAEVLQKVLVEARPPDDKFVDKSIRYASSAFELDW